MRAGRSYAAPGNDITTPYTALCDAGGNSSGCKMWTTPGPYGGLKNLTCSCQ